MVRVRRVIVGFDRDQPRMQSGLRTFENFARVKLLQRVHAEMNERPAKRKAKRSAKAKSIGVAWGYSLRLCSSEAC